MKYHQLEFQEPYKKGDVRFVAEKFCHFVQIIVRPGHVLYLREDGKCLLQTSGGLMKATGGFHNPNEREVHVRKASK